MEKQSNREEELIKKLMKEVGTEAPSRNFKSSILKAMETPAEIREYEPLIPKFAWIGIFGIGIASGFGLYLLKNDLDMDLSWNLDFPEVGKIPQLHISGTMQFAIMLLLLFLLEIPMIRKLIIQKYA